MSSILDVMHEGLIGGLDSQSRVHIRRRLCRSLLDLPEKGNMDKVTLSSDYLPMPKDKFASKSPCCRVTKSNRNEVGDYCASPGTRTPNPLIKSQLLYQLS